MQSYYIYKISCKAENHITGFCLPSQKVLKSVSTAFFACIFWITPFYPPRENGKKKPITPEGRRLLGLCGTRINRWLTHNRRDIRDHPPTQISVVPTDGYLLVATTLWPMTSLPFGLWTGERILFSDTVHVYFVAQFSRLVLRLFIGSERMFMDRPLLLRKQHCQLCENSADSPEFLQLNSGTFIFLQTNGKRDNWSCKHRHHNSHFKHQQNHDTGWQRFFRIKSNTWQNAFFLYKSRKTSDIWLFMQNDCVTPNSYIHFLRRIF